MIELKEGTWLYDLIEVYNELGGVASYKDVYALAEIKRKNRGASWTAQAKASIRRTVEDHASSSSNFKGKSVFYSVNGHGNGVWGLMPEYLSSVVTTDEQKDIGSLAYIEGLEGIQLEVNYLRRSRDPSLVEKRKLIDKYTCQACGYYLELDKGKFVIDVHHKNPLGQLKNVSITSIEDLICLCPNCHRIAHSKSGIPFTIEEVKKILGR